MAVCHLWHLLSWAISATDKKLAPCTCTSWERFDFGDLNSWPVNTQANHQFRCCCCLCLDYCCYLCAWPATLTRVRTHCTAAAPVGIAVIADLAAVGDAWYSVGHCHSLVVSASIIKAKGDDTSIGYEKAHEVCMQSRQKTQENRTCILLVNSVLVRTTYIGGITL